MTTVNIINLKKFLSNKKILHSETTYTYDDAILFLIKNEQNADIITYNIIHFLPLDNVIEIDTYGYYFYEFIVKRDGDIVDNIYFESPSNLNVKLNYYIGNIKYIPEEVNEFVMVSSQYNDFKIRVTFLDKPITNDECKIILRYYLINLQDRKLLIQSNVITKNITYCNGLCYKNIIQ